MVRDRLEVQFYKNGFFIAKDTGLPITIDYTVETVIPPQSEDDSLL